MESAGMDYSVQRKGPDMFDYEKKMFASEDLVDLAKPEMRSLKLRRALDWMSDLQEPRILDLGCEIPSSPSGCDVSERMIEVAKNQNDGIEYSLCSDSLPYEEGFFDAYAFSTCWSMSPTLNRRSRRSTGC